MSSGFFRFIPIGVGARLSPGVLVCAALALAFWIYLPAGVYLGGDWLTPATLSQSREFYYPYVWSSGPNFGMPWLLATIGLAYGLFVRAIIELGMPPEFLGKTVVTIILPLAFFFLYRLLRYIGLSELPSIIAGLVYVTSAVFFNFVLMGWIFVLLAMALFPLATQWLCRSVRQDDMRYAVGVAFIWSLAMLQSQSLVWFPVLFMALGCYFIRDWESARAFFRKLSVVLIIFIGLNAYWWVAIGLFQDQNILNSEIMVSDGSVAADSHFTPLNTLKLWGGALQFSI